MINDHLKRIVESTPGCVGAILMGFDGIAVMQYNAEGHEDRDLESLSMEMSFRFMELRKAAEALDLGGVTDITIKTESATVLCRILNEEYFVCSVLDDPGHFGKGRWALRSAAPDIEADL